GGSAAGAGPAGWQGGPAPPRTARPRRRSAARPGRSCRRRRRTPGRSGGGSGAAGGARWRESWHSPGGGITSPGFLLSYPTEGPGGMGRSARNGGAALGVGLGCGGGVFGGGGGAPRAGGSAPAARGGGAG